MGAIFNKQKTSHSLGGNLHNITNEPNFSLNLLFQRIQNLLKMFNLSFIFNGCNPKRVELVVCDQDFEKGFSISPVK